jgi:hypothetical protein
MRQPVVIIRTADLDSSVLVWAGLVGDQIICVMPPRALESPLHRHAAVEAVIQLTKNTNIEPEWPWESDPVA